MEKIDIANGLIFKELCISSDNFKNTLIGQKKIYLLESSGVDLGYSYDWYMSGPYSSELNKYIYENIDALLNIDFKGYSLSENVKEMINKINLLSEKKPKKSNDDYWYELLASLLYIENNRESWNITKPTDIYDSLIEQKSSFEMDDCEHAYDDLIKTGFIETNGE